MLCALPSHILVMIMDSHELQLRERFFLLQIFSCSSTSVTPFLSIFAFFVISCHLCDPSIPVRDNCCCDTILINHNCISAVIYKYHPLDQLTAEA